MKKIMLSLFLIATISFFATVNAQTVFLGKGAVQTALGLNNAELQGLVASYYAEVADGDDDPLPLSFTYGISETYEIETEWYTGPVRNRTKHEQTKVRTFNVGCDITFTTRKNIIQITGFWLTFGELKNESVELPRVGDIIEGHKTVVSVSLVSSVGGGLRVNNVLIPDFVL